MAALIAARSQLTLRVSENLARRLKQVAAEEGKSVNAYAEFVLETVVDPELAGSERERLRERFARAGLLGFGTPVDFEPPTDEEIERIGKKAARGTPASELIRRDRDERGF